MDLATIAIITISALFAAALLYATKRLISL
jgi:hypothetical protein